MLLYKSHLKEKARILRKSMTDAELRLWRAICKKQIIGLRFYRQKPLGHYIVDFYCPDKKIVIEVDGSQHYEDQGLKKDKERDKFFQERLGLKVLRFTNLDILQNMEGVVEKIMEEVKTPSISLPFEKGESERNFENPPLSPFLKGGVKVILTGIFALLGFILPTTVSAVSTLEFFPVSFDQTIELYAGDPWVITARIINAVLMFLGVIAVVLIIYGGFVWMTAGGNEERIGRAKKILINAGIGLVIILSSFIITRFLFSRLLGSLSAGEAGYEGGSQSGFDSSSMASDFYIKGFSPCPSADVPIRNVVIGMVFNRTPDKYTAENGGIVVTKGKNGPEIAGKLEVSGQKIKFTPATICPAPDQKHHCFDADTDFHVALDKEILKSVNGTKLSCGEGLRQQPCEFDFRTGSIVDLTPPKVTIISPNQNDRVPVDSFVQVQAQVEDDGGVGPVDFYVDNNLIMDGAAGSTLEECESFPNGIKKKTVEVLWDTSCLKWNTATDECLAPMPAPSKHTIKAVAADIDKNETTSSPVAVWVMPTHCGNGLWDPGQGEEGIDCGDNCGPGICPKVSCRTDADCPTGYDCPVSQKICRLDCSKDSQCVNSTYGMKCVSIPPMKCGCNSNADCRFGGKCNTITHRCTPNSQADCPPGSLYRNDDCVYSPKITDISPGDGKAGNFVTVAGLYFGNVQGTVTFTNNVTASAPAACDSKTSWQPTQVLTSVPEGAVDGPIKLCTADGLCDSTNDARGPLVPTQTAAGLTDGSFEVNDVTHPGLCLAYSPTEHTACTPGSSTAGDAFCQNENKDAVGGPDKTVFCSKEENVCVRPKGGWNTAVYLKGDRFGQNGYVSFGGQPKEAQNFTDTSATTTVPPLKYGGVKVQLVSTFASLALNNSKLFGFTPAAAQSASEANYSNAVDYEVLSPDAKTLPEITEINGEGIEDDEGSVGGVITIKGKNFGAEPGLIWFEAPDGQIIQGDTSFHPACLANNAWWQEDEITIKVPRVTDISDLNRDGSKTDILASPNYKIYIRRYDSVDSNKKNFEINNTPPGPSIHCFIPNAGPHFTNITVYGERFGTNPKQEKHGLFFSPLGAGGLPTKKATLTNTGAPGEACPSSGWSSNKICAQVPGEAVTGDVRVAAFNSQKVDVNSNPINFTVGRCDELITWTDVKTNPPKTQTALKGCKKGQQCCSNGVCADKCLEMPQSAYGWDFSTSPVKVVPHVIEECVKDSIEGGRFASPSPWSGRIGGDKACVNALAAARFDTTILSATLGSRTEHPNVILEKCGGGVESENLAANGNFETTLATGLDSNQWRIIDSSRLAVTQIAAPQDDLLDDSEAQANTIHALRLEKLQEEPDRGINESEPGKRDGNEYRRSFAAQFLPNIVADGKSYKISVKVKAAQTTRCAGNGQLVCQTDGDCVQGTTNAGPCLDGKTTAIGQKAGLLFRKLKAGITPGVETPEDIELEQSDEVILKDVWQEISLTVKTERTSGTAEVIFYLTSPPAGADITTYHRYAAYFDDLKIIGLDTVICNQASVVASALQPQPTQPNGAKIIGFTLSPIGGFEEGAWYRVTLKNDITAEGDNGAPMEEDAARCGVGNSYCWLFKTSNQKCKVGKIWTMPDPYTAKIQNELINYSALPVAADDVCINLDPSAFSWAWLVDDNGNLNQPARIASQTGQFCQQDADCPIGNCLADVNNNKSCQQMDWTKTITAAAETMVNPALVTSKITNAEYDPAPAGLAKLFIQFVDPVVTNYWPACQSACLNADIGAGFNIPMEATTLTMDNVKLYELTCGNGKVDSGEDCDDGNMINGDGCSSRCLNEGSNFVNKCGNGDLNDGEDCDDENSIDNDGCSAKCLNEGKQNNPQTKRWAYGPYGGVCGNGVLDLATPASGAGNVGEECDDGNLTDNDGCSAKCLNEGTRSDIAICGNGKIEKGEECEKDLAGNWPPGNWCNRTTCLRQGSDATKCGNGKVDTGEECDPKSPQLNGSTTKQALCSAICLWTGTLKPTVLGGVGCGNGKVEIGEDCDDGNIRAGDGCNTTCLNEGGRLATNQPVCGNGGGAEIGEDCDDNNTKDGDGCSAKCLNEGTGHAACGNGIKEKGESCDWKIFEATYGADLAKIICNPASCLNQGALTDLQKSQFTAANKPVPVCGNGRLEDGEDCDGGVGCNTSCLHTGRSQEPIVVSFTKGNIETINGQSGPTSLVVHHPDLTPLATYRVVFSQNIKSKSGKPLTGLNYSSPLWPSNVGNKPNSFSWTFTTKNERCAVDKVEVSPADVSLYIIGAKQAYESIPWSRPDECSAQGQRLTNLSYGWGWKSENASVAEIAGDLPQYPLTTLAGNYVGYQGIDKIPVCGDGIIEIGEECDDGNQISGDGCKGTENGSRGCLWEGSNYANQCGNGRLDTGESCDQRDIFGLICTPRCLSGPMRAASFCVHSTDSNCCGNGGNPESTATRHEECDDGNFVAGDGCSPYCTKEGSFSPLCGNGTVDQYEQCDKDNQGNFPSGCDQNTCLFTGTGSATCGNGIVEWGEACDDNNMRSGDGCSAVCLTEGTRAEGTLSTPPAWYSAISPTNSDKRNMGIDPYQKAEAVGLAPADVTANRSWSMTSVKAKVVNVQSGDEDSQDKEGSGTLTVYCGMHTDQDCAVKSGEDIKNVGRGDNSCCYPRPTLGNHQPTVGQADVCPNALVTATFSTLMNTDSLAGNFILARGVAGKNCPAGTVPVDLEHGRVLTLVDNGSFEDPLIKRNSDGTIIYQTDDSATTVIDESKLPQTNTGQAEGWQFKVGAQTLGQDALKNNNIVRGVNGYIGSRALWENYSNQDIKAVKHLTLNGGVTYRLSAFYKVTSGNNQVNSARLSIRMGNIYEDGYDVPISATQNEWHSIYRVFKPPRTGEYTIELVAQKPIGILWDDVSLEVLAGTAPLSAADSVIASPEGAWRSRLLTGLLPRLLAVHNDIMESIRNLLSSLFGSSAQAETLPPPGVWCTGEISFTLSTEKVANGSTTKVTLQPSKMLEKNTKYRLIVRGDQDLTDDIKEGVLSASGVVLDASGSWAEHGWNFSTSGEICTLDKVDIAVAALAETDDSGTETAIRKAGAIRHLTAQAISLRGGSEQPLQSYTGYGWSWLWNDSDVQNELITLADVAEHGEQKTLTAKDKNGEVVMTATAKITDYAAVPADRDKEVSGTKQFAIFICERPWPSAAADYTYKDDTGNLPMNFSTKYCLDAGVSGPSDDLPELLYPGTVLTPSDLTSRIGDLTIAASPAVNSRVLKEFLFPVPPSSQDIIGIRVMENPDWLSAMNWYRVQGFVGQPQPSSQPIDGYEAIQDGNTVYIAATNEYGGKIYSNIYLISYNLGATIETKNIRDQIVNNFKLNINLQDNQRVCSEDTNKNCSWNHQCIGAGFCLSPKDKLARDVVRVKNLVYMSQILEDYKLARGEYPRLEAGSYIRGMTNSHWPSWSAVLGNAMGASLPDDPLGQSVGIYKCEGVDYAGFDKTTCWNATAEEFKCPAGSMAYFYKNIGPASYELGARFEYQSLGQYVGNTWTSNWVNFSPLGGGSFSSDFCPALAPTGSTGYSTKGYCGDGKINAIPNTDPADPVQYEVCELGQMKIESHTIAATAASPKNVCSGNTSKSCVADSDCTNEGVCTTLKQNATAFQTKKCAANCFDWENSGTSYLTAYCGDGIVQSSDLGEVCDDGLLNGQYGKCAADCSGQANAGYCGDGIINGPEKCDRQTYNYLTKDWSVAGTAANPSTACNNGDYGCCQTNCSGSANGCGDNIVTDGEKCDPVGSQQTSKGYCDSIKNPNSGQVDSPCANDGQCGGKCSTTTATNCLTNPDCPTGETCVITAGVCNLCPKIDVCSKDKTTPCSVIGETCDNNNGICTKYDQGRSRTCLSGCMNWNTWGICSIPGGVKCGNGVKEGTEECDDGNQDETDSCTNDCRLLRCGDGKVQSDKVCISPVSAKWKICGRDSDCGTGGKCQATESCDMGGQNGISCSPSYGLSCAYCGNNCQKAFIQGPYCGDHTVQSPQEQCDGSVNTNNTNSGWSCIGEPEKTDWWWDKWDATPLPIENDFAQRAWSPEQGWYLLKVESKYTPDQLRLETIGHPLWPADSTVTTSYPIDRCLNTGNGTTTADGWAEGITSCSDADKQTVAEKACQLLKPNKACASFDGTEYWTNTSGGTRYFSSKAVCTKCSLAINELKCGVDNILLNADSAIGVTGNRGVGSWTRPGTTIKEVSKDAPPSNTALQITHRPGDKDIAANFDAIPDTNGKKYKLTVWVKAGDGNAVGKDVKIVVGRKGGPEYTQGINTDQRNDQRVLNTTWQKIELLAPFETLTGLDPKGYVGLRVLDTGSCQDYTVLFDKIHLEILPANPICGSSTCFVSCPNGGVPCHGSNCNLDSDNDGDPDITDRCPSDPSKNSDTGTGSCAP